jgi:hypothetical protein
MLSRDGRIRFTLRTDQFLPPTGLLTFRFDARRFPLTPGTCYRAPWRLPGPDSHRLANISLRPIPQATAVLTSLWSPAALRLLDTRCAQHTCRRGGSIQVYAAQRSLIR